MGQNDIGSTNFVPPRTAWLEAMQPWRQRHICAAYCRGNRPLAATSDRTHQPSADRHVEASISLQEKLSPLLRPKKETTSYRRCRLRHLISRSRNCRKPLIRCQTLLTSQHACLPRHFISSLPYNSHVLGCVTMSCPRLECFNLLLKPG